MNRSEESGRGPAVQENFFENLRAEVHRRLLDAGFQPPALSRSNVDRAEAACRANPSSSGVPPRAELERHEKLTSSVYAYFNVLHRAIPQRPRAVFRSRALDRRVLSAQQQRGVVRLERAFQAGEPLGLYQSKLVDKADEDDLLLNMWGIHHLHFVRRGDPVRTGDELLFVVALPDRALFVDVGDHNDFGSKRLVNIIDETWPEVLGPTLPGVVRLTDAPRTSGEEMALREAGVMTLTQLDSGRVVMPTGGITTSKLSGDVVGQAHDVLNGVRRLSDWLKEDPQRASDAVKERAGVAPRKLKFSLRFDGETVSIEHEGTRARIPTDLRLTPLQHRASRLHLPPALSRRRDARR